MRQQHFDAFAAEKRQMFGALEKKMDDRFDALEKKMEAGSERVDHHFANLAHKINILDEHLGTVEVRVNQIDQRLEAGGQAALHDGETRMRMPWALSQTRKVDPRHGGGPRLGHLGPSTIGRRALWRANPAASAAVPPLCLKSTRNRRHFQKEQTYEKRLYHPRRSPFRARPGRCETGGHLEQKKSLTIPMRTTRRSPPQIALGGRLALKEGVYFVGHLLAQLGVF